MVSKNVNRNQEINKEKKEPPKNRRFEKIKEAIQKEKTMSEYLIVKRLQRVETFIGSFPSDEIPKCSSFPSFFVLNTDKSTQKGTHWLAIREDENLIEVYDSLNLKNYPDSIKSYLSSKPIRKIRKIQPNKSFLCGLYSCFFILYRQSHSFSATLSKFSRKLSVNDEILFSELNKIW